ncbi:hypothetical protein [Notoacmeibacter sp. MSK16QG-6]|uniref:hypothetical protein n=1 Tax=Notoacmeibacter sp. MSK16QG-6 TaxID=2957982 RepID=UPI00209E7B90|nr:hypothetical protein [Notoacmeibacter sp. MSK16QG-6]MCP1200929.1 hypothetical protein [Notoacmeibacter sp. MSK16QG-6]
MTRFRSQTSSKVALADADDFEPFGQAPATADFEPLGSDDNLVALPNEPASSTAPLDDASDDKTAIDALEADPFAESADVGLAELPPLSDDALGSDPDPFGDESNPAIAELPSALPDIGADDPFGAPALPDLDALPSLDAELPSLEPLSESGAGIDADPFAEQSGADLPELPALDEQTAEADPLALADLPPLTDPFESEANAIDPALPPDDPFAQGAADDPFATAPEQSDSEVAAFETALQEDLPSPHPIAGESLQDAAQALSDLSSDPLGGEAASLGAPADLDNLRHAAENATEVIGDEIAADAEIGHIDPTDNPILPAGADLSGEPVGDTTQPTVLAQTLVDELERSLGDLRDRLLSEIGDSVAAILEPLVSRVAADRAVEAFGEDIAATLANETSDALFHAEVPQNLLDQVRDMIEQRGLPIEVKAGRHDALLLHLDNATRAINLPRLQDYCEAL